MKVRSTIKGVAVVVILVASGSAAGQTPQTSAMTPLQRAQAGKALWEEKCRTVAGERIYQTVKDVEGIVLLKVRPQAGGREWADPMWSGAVWTGSPRRWIYRHFSPTRGLR